MSNVDFLRHEGRRKEHVFVRLLPKQYLDGGLAELFIMLGKVRHELQVVGEAFDRCLAELPARAMTNASWVAYLNRRE